LFLVAVDEIWSYTLKHGAEVHYLRLNAAEHLHPSQLKSELVRKNITVCDTSIQNHHAYPNTYFRRLTEFGDEFTIVNSELAFNHSALSSEHNLCSQSEPKLFICEQLTTRSTRALLHVQ